MILAGEMYIFVRFAVRRRALRRENLQARPGEQRVHFPWDRVGRDRHWLPPHHRGSVPYFSSGCRRSRERRTSRSW